MYYTVYKIINLLNGKVYIGVHKTEDLYDGYMGSGKAIKNAISKYGSVNFIKEYIAIFDNQEDMFDMESKLVDEDFILDRNTYNIKLGGYGGWDFSAKEKFLELLDDHQFKEKFGKSVSDGLKKKYRDDPDFKRDKIQLLKEKGNFTGKKHSLETKIKMSKAKKGIGVGNNNSQYGTIWITNGLYNKKIKKDDVIPDGWYKGRVI